MTLNFSSWILCPSGPTFIGYQYDNLTDVLQVTGTVPAGWSWDLMVQCGTNLNIIPMEQAEDGSLSVVLTAEMIPLTGYYTMQLRATQGGTCQIHKSIPGVRGREPLRRCPVADRSDGVHRTRTKSAVPKRTSSHVWPKRLLDDMGRYKGEIRREHRSTSWKRKKVGCNS